MRDRLIRLRRARAIGVALALAVLCLPFAQAHHYHLESATAPAPFRKDGRVDDKIEPSAIAPLGDGHRVLVADDRTASLHVVDVATGESVGAPLSSPKFPPTTGAGPDWKGMAVDSKGNYYLVGSHYGKNDEERAARSAVIRFRLRTEQPPAIDDASVVRWDIAGPLEAALRAEGLDTAQIAERSIEGLAVREVASRRELVFGLRKPDDKVRAFAANIPSETAPGATLRLRPVFAFDAGRREGVAAQLTSLECVPVMGGFLVLTSSVGPDHAFRGNTLWLVAHGEKVRARRYETFEAGMKAGGMAVLHVGSDSGRTVIKLLITYDNDPHATGIPSRFQTATLVHGD